MIPIVRHGGQSTFEVNIGQSQNLINTITQNVKVRWTSDQTCNTRVRTRTRVRTPVQFSVLVLMALYWYSYSANFKIRYSYTRLCTHTHSRTRGLVQGLQFLKSALYSYAGRTWLHFKDANQIFLIKQSQTIKLSHSPTCSPVTNVH